MRIILKWLLATVTAALFLLALLFFVVLQEEKCDRVGNVEKPECVLND